MIPTLLMYPDGWVGASLVVLLCVSIHEDLFAYI